LDGGKRFDDETPLAIPLARWLIGRMPKTALDTPGKIATLPASSRRPGCAHSLRRRSVNLAERSLPMKRPLGPVFAVLLLVGCRAPAPANDPFLYRSTVPPPGTVTPLPGGQPLYPSTAVPPSAIPGPATAPPLISPGTPVQPGPAGAGPALQPVPRNNNYLPTHGGFNFPQSSQQSPAAAGGLAANSSPATGSLGNQPADSAVVPASAWQPTGTNPPNDPNSNPNGNLKATAEPSVIRIVEPSATSTASPSPDAQSAQPATVSTGIVSTNTLRQSLAPAPVPEITDLPPAGASPASGLPANVPKPSPTANQAPVNLPGDHPGSTYGYDPDYKTLRGRLEYSVTSRLWKLRYLPAEGPIDEYGGSVVIPDPRQLDGFESADFVTVQGTFTAPTASGGGSSSVFAVQRIKRQ
jgi:hypothetical protein